MAQAAPITPPFGQNFLDHPKTNHHMQIMVLCIILGIVVVVAWLYAVLSGPRVTNVTTPTQATIDTAAQDRSKILSALSTASTPTTAQVKNTLTKLLGAKSLTVTDAQKQDVLSQLHAGQN